MRRAFSIGRLGGRVQRFATPVGTPARDVTVPDVGPLDASADAQWLRVAERLQRGLNHALSNRVAAIAGVVSVMEPSDTELLGNLRDEVERLEALLNLMRLMPRADPSPPEPTRLADLLPDVLALQRQHPDQRDVPLTVTPLDDVPPIRCRPQALQHALLLLLVDAISAGAPPAVSVVWTESAVTVVVGAVGGGDGAPGIAAHPSAVAAQAMLALEGAIVWDAAGPVFFVRLPTLAALRAREKARVST